MEAIIDAAVSDGNKIDAILAENDSTALGVVGALTAKSYGYPPLSGQDGDPANLNNVALGKQYVDVWKNANELGKTAGAAALAAVQGRHDGRPHAAGRPHRPGGRPDRGPHGQGLHDTGRHHRQARSSCSRPRSPRTTSRWSIDAGQITKEELCKGVDAATAPAACK